MSAATTEIAPTYDFDKLAVSLKANPETDLASLLNELAKVPAPSIVDKPVVKKADPSATQALNEEMNRSVAALAKVFGKVALPATRRELRSHELTGFLTEQEELNAAKKVIEKRLGQIKDSVSDHFDVVVEKAGIAEPGKTPVDKNGHYLVGGSSKEKRLEARVPGAATCFVREKAEDKTSLSGALLLDLYESGKITRAEYLAVTTEVTSRVLDQSKLRAGLLSKARMARTQEIIEAITVVTYGNNSINVRK